MKYQSIEQQIKKWFITDNPISQVVNNEILKKLRDQYEILEDFQGHKIDDSLIQHLQDRH